MGVPTIRVIDLPGYWRVPAPPGAGGEIVIPKDGRWSFNGSYDRPTFAPSVNTTWQMPPWEGGTPGKLERDHVIIRDGRIEYLGDCTHPLAGTTVEIPPLSEARVAMYYPDGGPGGSER